MLTRPYLVLCFAMAMATMGIGMVTPILPVYAKELGAGGAAVGLTFSSFAITQVLISPFSGRLADRYGRKPFILAGLLTYAIAAAGWWLTNDVASAILLRAFSGIGSALIFSLASAYVGDLAPSGYEGRYMGTFGVATFAGMGVGPLVAGVIRDQSDIDTVFISMALLFTVSTVVVLLLLPRRPVSMDGLAAAVAPAVSWGRILGDRMVQALFVVRTAFSLAMGASFSFVAIYLEEELLATATMVGVLLAGQQLTGGILQAPAGMLADRMSRRQLVVAGAILTAAGYSTLALTEVYAVILVGFVLGVGGRGADQRDGPGHPGRRGPRAGDGDVDEPDVDGVRRRHPARLARRRRGRGGDERGRGVRPRLGRHARGRRRLPRAHPRSVAGPRDRTAGGRSAGRGGGVSPVLVSALR